MPPFQRCHGCSCSLGLVYPSKPCTMPPITFQDLPLNIYMVIFGTGIFIFVLSLIFCCYFISKLRHQAQSERFGYKEQTCAVCLEDFRAKEELGVLPCQHAFHRKDTWKCNPATKHVFSWTLPHVTRPWLGPHLERVLPPALLISDDFQEENKILGVQCLHHIVLNVPGADLCQFNRAQVVFHALYNHLYSREAPLIQGYPPPSGCVCARRLGILVVRHLKRLERVILGYLEVSDGPEEEARLGILETLQCTIEHAWPRMPCRLPVLLKALLRLLWDVHTDKGPTPEPVRAALLQRATQCLILLDRCSQGQVKVLLEGVYSSCEENRVRECIRKVQEST
ncbi:TELO2 interacting protein 2 [Willisornis vidua]|uniref:TELO2 interacting protein 2 n=1 Tax=Willisornis vidua TaxID=1566151 RepID=A0ABQ9CQM3_9PASS|nr:TELO2 interacting protein 2 [Willisornis vidua]